MPPQEPTYRGSLSQFTGQVASIDPTKSKTEMTGTLDLGAALNPTPVAPLVGPTMTTTPAVARKPVGSISTDQAVSTLDQSQQKLDTISPTTSPTYQPPPAAPTGDTPPKAFFTNEAGQEAEFTQDQLNDPANKKLLEQGGYVQTKTEGPTVQLENDISQLDTRMNDLITEFDKYSVDNDPVFQGQANSIRDQFSQLKDNMMRINRQRGAALQTMGYRTGTARYAGAIQAGIEGEELRQGNQRLADISRQEAQAIAEARQAFEEGSYKKYQMKLAGLEKIRENKSTTLKSINDKVSEYNKAFQELIKENNKQVDDVLKEVSKNGAPSSVIAAISKVKSEGGGLGEALGAAGDYMQGGSGIVGEYNFYKRQAQAAGQMPMDFDSYQNVDANRKARATAVATGMYSSGQEKIISSLNDKIAQSDTFKRTSSMRGYKDNVVSALSLGTGVSDLAAINQFQKVIDEGAVTRDQDVKLIQQSQSLLDGLKTKAKKLAAGDQLSPEQRKRMIETVETLYSKQVEALQKDPYIKSKQKELERNKINIDDTIIGELGGLSPAEEVVNSQAQYKTNVDGFITSKPKYANQIADLYNTPGVTDQDIWEYIQQNQNNFK